MSDTHSCQSNPDPASAFARSVLDVAAQVEQAENEIKAAIMAAAKEGDCAKVIEIVGKWQRLPTSKVLENGP